MALLSTTWHIDGRSSGPLACLRRHLRRGCPCLTRAPLHTREERPVAEHRSRVVGAEPAPAVPQDHRAISGRARRRPQADSRRNEASGVTQTEASETNDSQIPPALIRPPAVTSPATPSVYPSSSGWDSVVLCPRSGTLTSHVFVPSVMGRDGIRGRRGDRPDRDDRRWPRYQEPPAAPPALRPGSLA